MKTLAHTREDILLFPKKKIVSTVAIIALCALLLAALPYKITQAATWPNLIGNPSMEQPNPTNATLPLQWTHGGWGANTAAFTYPATGQDGARAGSVSISAYTNGDAKWVFDRVAVTPGTTYQFGEYYQSNVDTELVIEYTKTDNTLSYVSLASVSAAANWTPISQPFTVPTGVKTATVFHVLKSIGTLVIDTASLASQDTTPPTSGNLIFNPSVETASPSNPSLPLDWLKGGWGTNAATFTYPTVAQDGVKGIGVRLTAYTSGDAKWYFKHVLVIPGETYTFSEYYQSDVQTTITLEYRMADGTFSYVDLGTLPSATAWTNYTKTFIPPANTVSVSAFHHIERIGFVNTDNFSLLTSTSSGSGDTTPPIVSITAPTNGSIVSNATNLVISASDNIAIASVHYSVTNANDVIVGQLMNAPYAVQIPITSLKNGSHTITVYATDTAGNIGNAMPVTYNTFYTPPPPQNPNLILNPSFENIVAWLPDHWLKGGYGTNTASFNYPAVGFDGGRAAEISMSAWTNGDAKWYFEDVAVKPGEAYTFSDQYKSTTATTLNLRYTNADGSFVYGGLISSVPASANWTTISTSITIPANATKLTIFHLINSVGTLDIDDAKLTLWYFGSLDPNAFPTGMVSLTFDDGWGSHYDAALPMLNAAGIKAGFYIITNEMKNAVNPNRVKNPSFETAGSWAAPSFWTASSAGMNNAVYSYPVTGISGGKAAKIDVTSYTSGEAKWRADNTTVVDWESYNFTDQYMATVPTTITVEYTLNNGTKQVIDLGTMPAQTVWSIASVTFTPPSNVKTLSVYHRLSSVGSLTTDDYHLDIAQDYMNTAQVRDIYNAGHEVSAHTRTHPFLTSLSTAQATAEISGSRQDLISAGFTPSDTFVYPYGNYNPSVIQLTKDAGYIGARSVDQGYNTMATNKYALMIQEVSSGTTATQWESWVQTAMANHTWLILMYHQIDHQFDEFGATPEDLQTFLNYIQANGIPTVTMWQGLRMMNP